MIVLIFRRLKPGSSMCYMEMYKDQKLIHMYKNTYETLYTMVMPILELAKSYKEKVLIKDKIV